MNIEMESIHPTIRTCILQLFCPILLKLGRNLLPYMPFSQADTSRGPDTSFTATCYIFLKNTGLKTGKLQVKIGCTESDQHCAFSSLTVKISTPQESSIYVY